MRISREHRGMAPPESRLPPSIIGSFAIPVGLFVFAFTNDPSIHWVVSIIATVPFGFGMVLTFLSIMNYLVDSYLVSTGRERRGGRKRRRGKKGRGGAARVCLLRTKRSPAQRQRRRTARTNSWEPAACLFLHLCCRARIALLYM